MEITRDELADKLGGIVTDPEFATELVFAELRFERNQERMYAVQCPPDGHWTPGKEPGQPIGDRMTPTIGRIVHYTLSSYDAAEINRRREDFAAFNRANRDAAPEPGHFPGRSGHVGHYGNPASEGDVCAAVVTAAWDGDNAVNLKVLLDGNDDYWATSRSEGDGPGVWSWPPRA